MKLTRERIKEIKDVPLAANGGEIQSLCNEVLAEQEIIENQYLIECIEHWKRREPRLWWRPRSNGYTWDIRAAGRYSEEEAKSTCRGLSNRDEQMHKETDVMSGKCGKIFLKEWDDRILVCVKNTRRKVK